METLARDGGLPPSLARFSCFVALGDSFTEGAGCPPRLRWADRLAASLEGDGVLTYLNLAREGATSADVLAQLPAALRLRPDLVTVVCGANDVLLTPRPDPEGFAVRFATILDQLRSGLPEATLVTATVPEHWRFMRLGPRTARRVSEGIRVVNEQIRELAGARAIECLEVAGHSGLEDPTNFGADGLHASSLGHERTALMFERVLCAPRAGEARR